MPVRILMYEKSFTPALKDFFLRPSSLGGVAGQGGLFSRLRYSLDNGLRGTTALRTMLHERWHAEQFRIDPSVFGKFANWPLERYLQNPIEWTQGPTYGHVPFGGAFNSELIAPYGWVANAHVSGQLTLVGAAASEQR